MSTTTSDPSVSVKKSWLRRLYDWTLSWAQTPYGLWAMVGLSFVESSFFPIPPDVLLVALCFAKPRGWFWYALWCSVASVLGGVFGWWIGMAAWDALSPFFFAWLGPMGFTQENFDAVQALYSKHGFWAILGAAFTPIPYKVFTIASGAFHFPLYELVLASAIGRTARFMMVALVIRVGGPTVKPYLEKHFEIAAVVLFLLGVLGFVAIKFLKHL